MNGTPTIQDYIDSLNNDKQTLAANILAKGVQASQDETFTSLAPKVLQITGQSTDSPVYLKSSVAEMNQIENPNEGDYCVVISETTEPLQANKYFRIVTFQPTVTLSEAMGSTVGDVYSTYLTNDLYSLSIDLSYDGFNFSLTNKETHINKSIHYDSSNGKDYTLTSDVSDPLDLLRSVIIDSDWHDEYASFITVHDINFSGLYQYNNSSWVHAFINVPTTSSQVFPECKAYTDYGMITGSSELDIVSMNQLCVAFQNQLGDLTSLANYFRSLGSTQYFPLTKLVDTKNVTTMYMCFQGDYRLLELDLSTWNTSSTTNMSNMFQACENIEKINLTGFDTSKVTTFSSMFTNCYKLTEIIGIEDFNTSNTKIFDNMFANVARDSSTPIQKLDLSLWDTSNSTGFHGLFTNANILEADLSSFTIAKCTQVAKMFDGAKFTKLDIRSMDIVGLSQEYPNQTKFILTGLANNDCLIIVMDSSQKQYINTNFPSLTNVQTVEEYEASQQN